MNVYRCTSYCWFSASFVSFQQGKHLTWCTPHMLKDSYLSKTYCMLLIDTPEIAIFQAMATMFFPRPIKQPPEAFVQALFLQEILESRPTTRQAAGGFWDRVPVLLNENIPDAMGTHVSFIFRGYDPYVGGVKPCIFHGFGVQGWFLRNLERCFVNTRCSRIEDRGWQSDFWQPGGV